MFYSEQLRVRNGLIAVVCGLAAIIAITAVIFVVCRACAPISSNLQATLAVIGYSASLGAAIFGSIFGASLACQSDGHLEMVWTKPINRVTQALGFLLVDIAGIVAVFALIYAAGFVVTSMLSGHLILPAFDANSLLKLARFFAFPLAMFGLTQGLSAGIKGGNYGWAVGPTWPVTMGLFALLLLPLAAPWRAIVQVLNTLNPIMYFPYWEFDESIWHTYSFGYGVIIDTFALIAIACIGVIVATARWRRVEA